jgi:hypothetical protein
MAKTALYHTDIFPCGAGVIFDISPEGTQIKILRELPYGNLSKRIKLIGIGRV